MADSIIGSLQFKVDVDNSTGITNIKKFGQTVDETTGAVQEAEKKQTKAFGGINLKATALATAVGAAFVKVTKSIIEATKNIEEGQQTIVNATGATGESLAGLMDVAKQVYSESEQSFSEVSSAIGEINTRFGYTGDKLREVTGMFLDFAKATGQDVKASVASATQVMNQWNMSAEEMPLLLDKLTVAGQASGVSVSQLSANLTANAGTLQAMGYSLDESIALMMSFEKQGIDSNAVIMGMKQSFAQSAKAGTDARADWDNLLSSITNATSATEANDIAISAFGTRIASTMVTALQNGKISTDEFASALAGAEGALASTDEAGKTTADRIETLKHTMELAFADIGGQLAPMIEELLPTVLSLLKSVLGAIAPIIPVLVSLVQQLLPPLEPMLESLSKLIVALIEAVSPLLTLLAYGASAIFKPLIGIITSIAERFTWLMTPIKQIVKWMTGATESTEDYIDITSKATEAIDLQKVSTEELLAPVGEMTEKIGQASKGIIEATKVTEEQTEATDKQKEATEEQTKATEAQTEKTEENKEATLDNKKAKEELERVETERKKTAEELTKRLEDQATQSEIEKARQLEASDAIEEAYAIRMSLLDRNLEKEKQALSEKISLNTATEEDLVRVEQYYANEKQKLNDQMNSAIEEREKRRREELEKNEKAITDKAKKEAETRRKNEKRVEDERIANFNRNNNSIKEAYAGLNLSIGTAIQELTMVMSNEFATVEDRLEATRRMVLSFSGIAGDAIYSLGKDLAEGEDAWNNLGKMALKVLASIVKALAEEMLARAVIAIFQYRYAAAGALTAGAAAAFIGAGAIEGYANSLAVGMDYVPYDGYPASLHRGEMVLTKDESERFRNLGGLYGMEREASLPLSVGTGISSVNVNSNLSAVIEVDGIQLGVAVLKNIDNASQFVMR